MEDTAWAAGLFEGEGSIVTRPQIYHRHPSPTVSLWLRTTDLDVLERFAGVVAYGNITRVRRRACHTKAQFSWSMSARVEVIRVLDLLYPWFGLRRKEKALEALELLHER